MDTLEIIGTIIFFGSVIVGWGINRKLEFNGARYRDRLWSILFLAVMFTTAYLLVTQPDLNTAGIGTTVGGLLAIPFAIHERAWFFRHLDGSVLRYNSKSYLRNVAWNVSLVVGLFLLLRFAPDNILSASFVPLCIAVMTSTIVALLRLNRIEAALGEPVMEAS